MGGAVTAEVRNASKLAAILLRMDAECAREILLKLPHVVETQQWGHALVFWVGDKSVGGKMFCVMNLEGDGKAVVSYSAGPERFSELLERESLIPAPYMARIHWVAAEGWGAWRSSEWQAELEAAHAISLAKLAPKALRALGLLAPKPVKAAKPAQAAKAVKSAKAAARPAKRAVRSGR